MSHDGLHDAARRYPSLWSRQATSLFGVHRSGKYCNEATVLSDVYEWCSKAAARTQVNNENVAVAVQGVGAGWWCSMESYARMNSA